ncbi:hypothetical protein evm_009171 [Chilo suppressalis]|nr:hypothetical protein evm_009171 [Chilo suppressalis]
MREKIAQEQAAGEEDKSKPLAIDSPNDASSEDSNDSNRFQKGSNSNSSNSSSLRPAPAEPPYNALGKRTILLYYLNTVTEFFQP